VRAFVEFICAKTDDAEGLSKLLNAVEDELAKLNEQIVGKDFDRVEI
jgi:predicted  nucleic acid-binding Zn ribbon protein